MYKQAVLVLTNGLSSAEQVNNSTRNRLDAAAKLYSEDYLVITSTGYTVNKKPFLTEKGYPVFESVIAARYLSKTFRIPQRDIIAESFSRDTIGNLYLSFQTIIQPLEIKKIIIVTSQFHLERVKTVMNFLMNLFANYSRDIHYYGCEDVDYEADVWDAVIQKEQKATEQLILLQNRLQTSVEFAKWFFEEHRAYDFLTNSEPAEEIIQKAY